MAYSLYICRPADDAEAESVQIPLEEWNAAVTATDGVRLFAGKAHTFRIPITNQVLTMNAHDGDAEVLFPDGQWHATFKWFEGSGSFSAGLAPGDASHPVWAAAVSLATRLGAVIRGEEGETYDLQTERTRRPGARS